MLLGPLQRARLAALAGCRSPVGAMITRCADKVWLVGRTAPLVYNRILSTVRADSSRLLPGAGSAEICICSCRKLEDALQPEQLTVINESHKHAGHAGNPSGDPGAETHFRLIECHDCVLSGCIVAAAVLTASPAG